MELKVLNRLTAAVVTLCHMVVTGVPVSLPILYARGSHYDVGYQIGKTFSRNIQEYVNLHPQLHSVFMPWAQGAGRQIIDDYWDVAGIVYPQYMDELRGMAHGSNISEFELFVLNFNMEISVILHNDKAPTECSTLHVNHRSQNQVLLGHNEDTSPLIKDRGYLVHATIDPDTERGWKAEKWMQYTYPGCLSGSSFGFNYNGQINTINALYPKIVLHKKVGRYFLSRSLLASSSAAEVKHLLIHAGGFGVTTGFSVNLGIISKTGPEIWNFEVAPNQNNASALVNTYKVDPISASTTGNYFHVNKYRRFNVTEIPEKITSSIHRTKRIEQLPAPSNERDIRGILGDTHDKDYPIYRNPIPTDPGCTVATGIFNLVYRTLDIYKENPGDPSAVPVFHTSLPGPS